jgi:hypothetical protein
LEGALSSRGEEDGAMDNGRELNFIVIRSLKEDKWGGK